METRTTPRWLIEALEKLERLSRLEHNWDSYDGLPLQPAIRDACGDLLRRLDGDELPTPAVVLGSAGTVQLEWQHDGRSLEIEVLSPDVATFLKEDQDGRTEQGEIRHNLPDALRPLLDWLVGR